VCTVLICPISSLCFFFHFVTQSCAFNDSSMHRRSHDSGNVPACLPLLSRHITSNYATGQAEAITWEKVSGTAQSEGPCQGSSAHPSTYLACQKSPASKRCSRCMSAIYCDADCAKEHWPVHKRQCSMMAMAELIELVESCAQHFFQLRPEHLMGLKRYAYLNHQFRV